MALPDFKKPFLIVPYIEAVLSQDSGVVATQTAISAPELAHVYFDQVFKNHGLPKRIISNRDPRFTSSFGRQLFKLLDTKLAMSSAYQPIAYISHSLASPEPSYATDDKETLAIVHAVPCMRYITALLGGPEGELCAALTPAGFMERHREINKTSDNSNYVTFLCFSFASSCGHFAEHKPSG